MRKIYLLMCVLLATMTMNAQNGPMKASQMGNSTTVDELVGWFFWYNRTTSEAMSSDATEIKSLYDNGTNNNRYVCFTKVDESTIKIWGMFECPVTATVNLTAATKYIDIPTGQIVGYDKTYGELKLTQQTWSESANEGAGGWVTYPTVRMYLNSNSWYISNNWIRLTYTTDEGTYYYGKKYIPGFNYSYSRVATAYADWNAVMFVDFDKELQNYAYTTYPVNVTQDGNVVHVQNFCGGTNTINIELQAPNTLSIAPQVGVYSGKEYTYYPSPEGELGYDPDGVIQGTGTDKELTWGSFSRRIAATGSGYQYKSGIITFVNTDVDQFSFPEEPTGIRTVNNGEQTVGNDAWYTIDGKRLQAEPTTKGIYVRGGKKIVVK
ncbi:MAG: hypothetical protein IKH14_01590 [Prevotella sp.]|nr:hypothetical protein [Prevotella sp.]